MRKLLLITLIGGFATAASAQTGKERSKAEKFPEEVAVPEENETAEPQRETTVGAPVPEEAGRPLPEKPVPGGAPVPDEDERTGAKKQPVPAPEDGRPLPADPSKNPTAEKTRTPVPEKTREPGQPASHDAAMHSHVPPGHYPPPGMCRIWQTGVPPGHQAPPRRCETITHVPSGAFIVHNHDGALKKGNGKGKAKRDK